MTDKLAKVLDLLIAEDKDEAAKALNEWFAEQQATLTASLMEAEEVAEDEELDESITITIDDDSAVTDVQGSQPVAEADGNGFAIDLYVTGESAFAPEELFDASEFDEDDIPYLFLYKFTKSFDASSSEDAEAMAQEEIDALQAKGLTSDEPMEGLKAAGWSFVEGMAQEDGEEGFAIEAAEMSESDEDPTDDAEEFGGEEAGDEVVGDDDSAVEDLTVDERVEDLEAQLEALRAEFDKLMGDEVEDEAGEEEIVDGDSEEEETEGDDDVDEAIAPGVPGKKTTFVQKSGIDFGGNQDIREDEELDEEFADLAEAADYKLEPVKAETLKKEGEQAGNGKKVKVDKDSPIPQRKPTERMGGDPVEIKGKTHKGYARETAPAVTGGNEKFKNSQKAPKKISKEGDKSAELNKNKEDKSTKSPINGDPKLRGNDLSRK